MTREYTLTVETSDNPREVSEGVTRDQYDVVSTYDRDDWCKTVFENAKVGLDHEDGPSCCYVNASYID